MLSIINDALIIVISFTMIFCLIFRVGPKFRRNLFFKYHNRRVLNGCLERRNSVYAALRMQDNYEKAELAGTLTDEEKRHGVVASDMSIKYNISEGVFLRSRGELKSIDQFGKKRGR